MHDTHTDLAEKRSAASARKAKYAGAYFLDSQRGKCGEAHARVQRLSRSLNESGRARVAEPK